MSAPIGKFEYKSHTGKWVLAPAGQTMDMYGFIATKDGYRFRPNTYLKDAEGEYWYEGDEGWLIGSGKHFVVVYDYGEYKMKFDGDGTPMRPLSDLNDVATHTPPEKKYKRCTGEYDSCYGHPTEKRYIEVENQRVGEADRRKQQIGFDDFSASLLGRVPKGKLRGQNKDRRTGESA